MVPRNGSIFPGKGARAQILVSPFRSGTFHSNNHHEYIWWGVCPILAKPKHEEDALINALSDRAPKGKWEFESLLYGSKHCTGLYATVHLTRKILLDHILHLKIGNWTKNHPRHSPGFFVKPWGTGAEFVIPNLQINHQHHHAPHTPRPSWAPPNPALPPAKIHKHP